MAANSKNKLDVYKWISDMIETSKTADQLVSCNKLCHLYFTKHQEITLFYSLMNDISLKLKSINNTK